MSNVCPFFFEANSRIMVTDLVNEPLLTPKDAGDCLSVTRTTVAMLVKHEGLPHLVLSVGQRGRRIVRFRRSEIEAWLSGRRERQIAATIEGERFSRKGGIDDR